MNNFELLERLATVEPPDLLVTARVAAVLEGTANGAATPEKRRRQRSRLRVRPLMSATLAFAVLIIVAVALLARGGGLTAPVTSTWQSGHVVSSAGSGTQSRHGTWALVDDALSGTWQQNLSGPPPGYFTCPDALTCFAMSGTYASDSATAATAESLYASVDFGSTWTMYPMPDGFLATSPLACSSATNCAAGGTYKSQPVLITTGDGGHRFTMNPLPSAVGTIYSLSCPSALSCDGLVATSADSNLVPHDATYLSTSDGGAHFSDVAVVAGDSMERIVCASVSSCIAVGTSDAAGASDWASGVAAFTSDAGQTWSTGALPVGFGVDYLSQISCADVLHCSVIGIIGMPIANPPECGTLTQPTTRTQPPPQSPAIRAIANREYQYAKAAFNVQSTTGTCVGSTDGQTIVSDIASTTDGGSSWTPERLPSDAPQPQLTGISCPSDNDCWTSGSVALAQDAGKTPVGEIVDGGSSVVLATTNAGSSWSRVIFTIPKRAPNFEGQSFLSTAFISCPDVNDCAANGTGAQSAPSAPVYTLRIPSNAT